MKYIKTCYNPVSRVLFKSVLILITLNILNMALMASDHEDELVMERWMITPFEVDDLTEYDGTRQWMSIPFNDRVDNESLSYEEWMGIPFETESLEENVILEKWMEVPFDQTASEDMVTVEPWMHQPFLPQPADRSDENIQAGPAIQP